MKYLNQQLLNFDHEQNFKYDDFFVSKSNKHIFDFLNKWPNWEKNLLNINGENFSGKTHLINIFLEKFKGIKINAKKFNNDDLKKIKIYENIILEDLTREINEELFFTLINIIEQDNKYLIVTSKESIVEINFDLNDLKSRSKNFLLQTINKPDDELIFALLLKSFSDRQISIDKKLINYIIKRIDRSYSKIFHFIYKIDEMSLKKKNRLI